MKKGLLLLSVFLLILLGSCEKTVPDPEPVECEHVWPESYALVEPTVEEDGARIYTCVLCGKTKSETVPALSEDDYFVVREPAKCEEEGRETYTSEEWGEYEVVLPPTGHDFGKEPTERTTTCTEDGEKIYVCSRCPAEKRERENAYGHDYHLTGTYEATCFEQGYSEYVCLRCGDEKKGNYTDRKHNFVRDDEHSFAGDCTEEGYILYVCSSCEEQKKEYTGYAHIYNKDTGKCLSCGAACAHDFSDYTCRTCGFDIREELSRSGIYVYGEVTYFGSYPQSHVSDPAVVAVLDDYFSGNKNKTEYTYNGVRYVKADCTNQSNNALSFSDGTPLSLTLNGNRSVHYFRYDPIAWVRGKNGVLVADCILDSCAFQTVSEEYGGDYYFDRAQRLYENNWSVSDARAFLTDVFFEKAFDARQKAMITVAINDNTDSGFYKPSASRPWCTQDETTDSVFLPAFSDLYETDDVTDRVNAAMQRKVSDYALCTGIKVDGMLSGTASWYLRSAGLYSGYVCSIDSEGKAVGSSPVCKEKEVNGETKKTGMGIVPALKLDLSE